MSTAETSTDAPSRPPLALIAGPTASGKSDLAVELALAHEAKGGRAVVINADSAQVYRDLRVLSARPSPHDMRGIEHRLFGTWDGAQPCSAADWAAAAREEIANAHALGRLPILVGGTGLYLRTLLDGIAPVPAIDPEVRDAVRTMAQEQRYADLMVADPAAVARIAPADATRTARALEVLRSTGRTLADWQGETRGGIGAAIDLRAVILLPERAALYRRCDARFAAMMTGGAVEEVATLLARRLDPALPVMRAIGVREIAAMLSGELSREAAVAAAQQATRNYAKRQYTWLRHQPHSHWHRVEGENFTARAIIDRILQE
ncbi:tRNA (adenosine(37)-N6)-dimethylallyltransferase MiaA [Novosphingobium sp. Gsoil 351]|uniref:tRNA (adenosine(37)-N6)-dimethylallyltransferase MiaA n=1 Tax=Novosphingobium sp. Gsoil 351 TaxID=2675225 RepID=UPI0012B4DB19|nr:tRNA (adenosine(37)-N6)-dimethylallyltransferase MiaA [Novosphingobium sp. Gsoil 351]QGN53366.1 tRNA (adenosine(37)-N6)-dimethylallyltransferase MiaA [Novosphingobium sp. Gsoil 351]